MCGAPALSWLSGQTRSRTGSDGFAGPSPQDHERQGTHISLQGLLGGLGVESGARMSSYSSRTGRGSLVPGQVGQLGGVVLTRCRWSTDAGSFSAETPIGT